jgi:P-type Ca2+ transporter type 2C
MRQPWHASSDELAQSLKTHSSDGLSGTEAQARLAQYGHNQLKEKGGRSPLSIFLDQFKDFIVWVLVGAAVVSGFMGEWVDTLAIVAIVVLNAILGFVQEFRAEKSLAALKKLSSPQCKVIRDGSRTIVPSEDLVPGDLVELEAGDHVPADSRLVWITSNFGSQEASLTGESTPVLKTVAALDSQEVPLADRVNMVYMGTSIVSGRGRAAVVQTGMTTELGKIAGMIQDIEQNDTPLQRKLEEFGKWLVYLCGILVVMVFVLGIWRGTQAEGHMSRRLFVDMFMTSISLAVAAIPEGLPAVVTIALALGVQRMVKRHALVRKLPSVETLGCATVICSDKTGTLTRNEMTVQAMYAEGRIFQVTGIGYGPQGQFLLGSKTIKPGDHPRLMEVLRCGVLCNGAQLSQADGVYKVLGDPTEGALLTAAAKADLYKDDLEKASPFIEEIPFDSDRKMMTVIRQHEGRKTAFVKGAPDILLSHCTLIDGPGGRRPLSEQDRAAILKANNDLADQAMRVLAVASREIEGQPERYEAQHIEKDLIFMGLAAMIDPPREEVKRAMVQCQNAGIRTVMITGDHKKTAVAIARQLGFFGEDSLALTGEELDGWSDAKLAGQIEHIPVYARVSPEHKLRIVKAWRAKGHVVAMTGDGVNDAPAVKEADIGVAMGITGTDVTKEVSDMVVTDDNFASIVAAVEEGRGIYDNIQKFVHYLLSCNAGEILVMFVASLLGLQPPLLPIQILWVNLVTDGLPALALGMDPVDPDIMRRPPRRSNEAVVTKERAWIMVAQGVFIAACSLSAYALVLYVEKEGIERARTAAFVVLSCSQLFHSFNCRSMTRSLFRIGPFSNGKLVAAALISFALQMGAVYLPGVQKVFKAEPLGVFDWVLVIALSSLPLWAMELVKLVMSVRRSRGAL